MSLYRVLESDRAAKFSSAELQHLRGALPAQLAALLGTRQGSFRLGLAFWMMQVGPMRINR
jgi:hypothetical protein